MSGLAAKKACTTCDLLWMMCRSQTAVDHQTKSFLGICRAQSFALLVGAIVANVRGMERRICRAGTRNSQFG